jgi:nanoRNase/pAp phosphatase (c-di-AMP/oligoRNAs hydrolase)
MANKYPDRSYAILTERAGQTDGPSGDEETIYQVSIRAPKNNLNGADLIAAKFGGGGRKGAAGIDILPSKLKKELFAMLCRVCN